MTTPSPVQRYDIVQTGDDRDETCPSDTGDWVKYSDHLRITSALVEGLRKYAGHMGSCDKWRGGDVCTCGFDEMMKGVQG